MRPDFETPIDFASSKTIGNHQIIYKNLKEIAQGSPVIGQLSIDSEPIARGAFFGGPSLSYKNFIYVPIYKRNFFNSGFKLVRIDLNSKAIEVIIDKEKPLIFLESFRNGIIYYFEDMGQTNLKHFDTKMLNSTE